MAITIPTYDAPQVAPAALPNVGFNPDVSPIARGAHALGQGLQQVGGEGEAIANAIQQRQNAVDVTNRLTALSAAADKAHYGTGIENSPAAAGDPSVSGMSRALGAAASVDASGEQSAGASGAKPASGGAPDLTSGLSPNGLLNERGVNAFKYAGPTESYIASVQSQLADGLNPVAAEEFKERSNQIVNEYNRRAAEHVAQQHAVVDQAALHAATAQSLNDIANNYADPAAVEHSLATLEPSIKALAVSPDDAKAQIAAIRQKGYETALNQFIANKDWKGAQAFFAAKKGELGDEGATYQRQITVLQKKAEARTLVDGIMGGAKIGETGLYDMAKLDNDFRALPPEKRTDDAIQEFHEQKAIVADQNRAVASNYSSAAWSDYNQSKRLADIAPDKMDWLADNDNQTYQAILRQAREDADARAKGRTAKVPVSKDAILFYNQWAAAADKDPTQLQKITLDQIHHDCFLSDGTRKVTPEQEQKMMDKWRIANGQKPLNFTTLTQEQSHLVSTAAGGVPGLNKEDRARVRDRIETVVAEKRAAYKQAHNGAEPDPDMIQKEWIAPELAPGNIKNGGFLGVFDKSATRAQSEALPQYQGKTFEPDQVETPVAPAASVPADDAAAIRSQLEPRFGRKLTDDEVQRVYQKAHAPAPQPQSAAPVAHPNATQASLVSPVSQNLFNGGEDPPEDQTTPDIHLATREEIDAQTKARDAEIAASGKQIDTAISSVKNLFNGRDEKSKRLDAEAAASAKAAKKRAEENRFSPLPQDDFKRG